MSEAIEKTIDIDRILKGKMGAKAKFVPGFVVSWLKKLVHEDEVNKFLWESRYLSGTEWLTECVKYLKMDIEIVGAENLPDKNDGKLYTFVSNHPLGGQDGVALGSIIGQHYDGNFRYLVNDLLLNLPGLKPVSIGINKTGRNSRDFPRLSFYILRPLCSRFTFIKSLPRNRLSYCYSEMLAHILVHLIYQKHHGEIERQMLVTKSGNTIETF